MNRKGNPFISLVALVLLVTILVLTVTGCGTYETDAAATAPGEPVAGNATETESTEPSTAGGHDFSVELEYACAYGWLYVITDNQTGAKYLAFKTNDGVGMTALED